MRFDQLQYEKKRYLLFSFKEKTEIEILLFVNDVCQGNIIVRVSELTTCIGVAFRFKREVVHRQLTPPTHDH